ncbi:MAG: c-type cytochrome [Kofleriaceae bacterium]
MLRARAVALASLVVVGCGGKDDVTTVAPMPAPTAPAPPTTPAQPTPAQPTPAQAVAAQLAHGGAIYAKYCVLCHGERAEGYRADFAPSLVTETFLATASDAFLATGIVEGRPGTAMGAYGISQGGPLAPTDVTALIAWIRSQRPEVVRLELPSQPTRGDAARGKSLYVANCQSCHGDAANRINAVQLANPVFLESATDAFLRHAIVNGRPGTPMLPWQGKLDDGQIDDVIAYLRTWQPAAPTSPAAPPNPHAGHDHDHAGHDHGPPPALPPITGPVVTNPRGKAPVFTPREGRFVPAAQVADAIKTKKKMIFIDARTPADYARGHIPGAVLVPYYARERLDAIPNDGTWILAYCACPHHASGEVVDELRRRGYANTAIIDEGIVFWEKQGYPMARGAAGAP